MPACICRTASTPIVAFSPLETGMTSGELPERILRQEAQLMQGRGSPSRPLFSQASAAARRRASMCLPHPSSPSRI